MKCFAGGAFRVIRDSDIEIEEEAEDLVRYFRTAIKRRRRGRSIRLELEPDMPDELVALVHEGSTRRTRSFRTAAGLPRHRRSAQLVDEDRPDLKFTPFTRAFPSGSASMAAIVSPRSAPRTSSSTTPTRASTWSSPSCSQAAADPDVVAIKQTLYRAGKQSAIINALIDAAEAGKSVTAVVELKARFDEEQNSCGRARSSAPASRSSTASSTGRPTPRCRWWCGARTKGYRTYCHFGTGNYHPVTARIYTDLSFFTADPTHRPRRRQAVQLHHRLSRAAQPREARDLAAEHARRARSD